jgi:hypothetical protein
MSHTPGTGMSPPPPGQEKEEPDLWQEDDIPVDDRGSAALDEHDSDRPRSGDSERK